MVVTIVSMLLVLVIPAIQAARESARRNHCGLNLKQLATAAETHKSSFNHFPTGGWDASSMLLPGVGSDFRQPRGWCFTTLPFIEMQSVYDSFDPTAATLDTTTPVPVFACPSRRGSSLGSGTIGVMTDYAGNRGAWASAPPLLTGSTGNRTTTFGANVAGGLPSAPATFSAADWLTVAQMLNATQAVLSGTGTVATGGVIFAGSAVPPRIRDGAPHTYLYAEKYVPRQHYESGAWSGFNRTAYVGDSPDTLRGGHRPPESDVTNPTTGAEGVFGGPHVGGFMAAMCDGSVRFMDFGISPAVHFLLSCRDDRQILPAFD